jgi:hypothetical protein
VTNAPSAGTARPAIPRGASYPSWLSAQDPPSPVVAVLVVDDPRLVSQQADGDLRLPPFLGEPPVAEPVAGISLEIEGGHTS